MSHGTTHRHPETLCTLLFLVNNNEEPNADANGDNDGDSDDEEPSPLSGGLESAPIFSSALVSQSSEVAVPLPQNEMVVEVLDKIDFPTIITNTLATGIVSAPAMYFAENLKQMFEWSNPTYDMRKIGDFYSQCDRKVLTYVRTLAHNAPAHGILITVAVTKIVTFIAIDTAASRSILKNGIQLSISNFYRNIKQVIFNTMKLMVSYPQFVLLLKTVAYDHAYANIRWLEENPEAGYVHHISSLNIRIGIDDYLNSVNMGYLSEFMQYVEVWHIDAIKRGLNRKSSQEMYKVFEKYIPLMMTSTALFLPGLMPYINTVGDFISATSSTTGAIGAVSAASTTVGAYGVVGSYTLAGTELFSAFTLGTAAATMQPSGNQAPENKLYGHQWPTQPELDGSDELTPESTEDDTEDLQALSDDTVLRALQFIFGEDFDEAEAKREEVLFDPKYIGVNSSTSSMK